MCSVLIRISPPLFILLSFNSAIVRALCRCKHRFASSFGPRENRRSAQNSQTATELDALMLNRATMSYFADLENSQKWLRSEPQGSRPRPSPQREILQNIAILSIAVLESC